MPAPRAVTPTPALPRAALIMRRALRMRTTACALLFSAAVLAPAAPAQRHVTTPSEALGFEIGANYRLATYNQLEAYWRALARESPRMVLREIGKTAEGRPQLMAIITAQENHRRLARYQDIARRLALAEH